MLCLDSGGLRFDKSYWLILPHGDGGIAGPPSSVGALSRVLDATGQIIKIFLTGVRS